MQKTSKSYEGNETNLYGTIANKRISIMHKTTERGEGIKKMGKNQDIQKERKNDSNKTNTNSTILKWLGTVIIPLTIGLGAPFITELGNKNTEYIYMDSTKLDDFKADEYFPLEEGNYWKYERKIEYIDKKGKVREIEDEVKCKVIEKLTKDDLKLYVLEGNPFYTPDIRKDIKTSKHGYIVMGNKLISLDEHEVDSIAKSFKKDIPLDYDMVNGLEIDFEFPLYDRQKFGDTSQLLLHDINNTYYVEKLETRQEKRGNTFIDNSTFTIHNTYNSGDVFIDFVPYTGITQYNYEHRGMLNKVSCRLKEKKILND